jgi:short-subunit dehydrogenase
MSTSKKQTVWITGASSGIGKEMAIQYAKKGLNVVVSARRTNLLVALQDEINTRGGNAFAVACDVTDTASIEKCVQQIVLKYGQLDIVVANAGCVVLGFMEELTESDWQRQLNINVIGLAMTVKHALPELKKTKGRLALIGSVAAYVPNPMVGAYGASKAAVHNIGETLQVELKGTGVSCTTIHPGFVDSNITRVDNDGNFNPEATDPRPANLMWPTDKAVKEMIKTIEKRKKVKVITGHGKVFVFLGRFFPGIARVLMYKQLKEILKSK